ncbi:signal peptidase I P [bacterium BMS3Bbin06]|nr:signal peptidase I P [bacterium BMS3Abin08]GBE35289.1 signal peptidase I P [bacterium BMS3Bbin06]HDO35963.1 signal peptidase I [Nitrospirota bacterium]HDY71414.1 signal peptidase I [Nitrospirota bacterium]
MKKKGVVREYAEAIITALILALIIRAFVVQAFKIPSGSMIPTLLVGDHILVAKFIYGTEIPFTDKKILVFREPRKGDIIVFKYPKDPSRDFIKRVIAVGGDVVEGRNKNVFVNGRALKEPYIQHTDNDTRPVGMDVRDNFGPVYVPQGKIFVMGDNRDQSYDSRYWGFVDLSEVKGKAFIIYWSWDGKRHLPRLSRIGRLIR